MYPVPEAVHSSVVKSLSGNSVKVELYDLDGDEINTFYVGGAAYNYTGTYMLQEKAKKPYVVQIPNFHGFLSPVYSTDFDDWRDRSVMNLPSEQIAMVSMQYLESPEHSFTITNGETVSVKTTADTEGMDLNKDRVASYLRFFTEIYTEGYLNGIAGMDSTIASVPKFCIMEVTSKKGWKQHIEIFRMPLNKRSKNLATADEGDYDVDRFYGVINNYRDTVLLQAFTFDKFFRSGVEFFMKDQPASASMMGLPTQGQ